VNQYGRTCVGHKVAARASFGWYGQQGASTAGKFLWHSEFGDRRAPQDALVRINSPI